MSKCALFQDMEKICGKERAKKGKEKKKKGQSGEEKEIKPKGRREDDMMCQRGGSIFTDQMVSLGRRGGKS